MDLATVIGFLGAFGIVGSAIILGGDALMFLNIPSILIVVLGSIFVVMMKFNLAQVFGVVKIAMKAFMFKMETPEELITKSIELAAAVKKGGILALENILVENEFMSRGVNMLVDGYDGAVVKDILKTEKSRTQTRHEEGQRFFNAMTDVAPAMGMIGTLIGLVQMLANMSDPKSIGPAMAVALLTTLYGAIVANMISGPISDKLAMRSAEEERNQSLIIDAISCIEAGLHPNIVRDALQNYIPRTTRSTEDAAA
ncbi:MAG: flagellar motor protein PomA [Bdellovibrionales bacterium]